MAFGVYVHIPYCIQRCTYCDFATYEQGKILPPDSYVKLLVEEMNQKRNYYTPQKLNTLYFGGGTPSLLEAESIVTVIRSLARHGFTIGPDSEVTIEINPATVSEDKLKTYLDNGINRFSVGAQTFDDRLLKMVKREHSAKQTFATLELLQKYDLNFSFDILFALPSQTLAGLKEDVDIAVKLGAKHLSPYCLTVPDGHPLSKGRPLEEEQVEMFDYISNALESNGFKQYEISNFAIPGYESQHNLLYWTDQPWWGLGLSAHSYSKQTNWGSRYWNLSNINEYEKQINSSLGSVYISPEAHLPAEQVEELKLHQALTDFCHTSMRLMRGLSQDELAGKFESSIVREVSARMDLLIKHKLVSFAEKRWALTSQGIVLSNLVFERLAFLESEIKNLKG